MEFDLESCLGAVTRTVSTLERDGKPVRAVTLSRTYATDAEDLWDAVTNSERLPRWFLPVEGDLQLGGRYQFEGNAGGTITGCQPPRSIAATWEFGGELSWVEVTIAPEGEGRCRFTLSHICPVDAHWRKYGPGATGVGWDLGLVGLATHLSGSGAERLDETAFMASADGKAFVARSSEDWGRAAVAAGENPERAVASAKATTAFYMGEESEDC